MTIRKLSRGACANDFPAAESHQPRLAAQDLHITIHFDDKSLNRKLNDCRGQKNLDTLMTRLAYCKSKQIEALNRVLSMLTNYIPILIQLIFVVVIAVAILALSSWVGVKRPTREKLSPYECGIAPVGDARERFSVSFYLVGMLFILFDVEAVFLYPWAVVYRSLKWFGFVEMLLYIAILFAGYIYIWKKGALDWNR